VAGARKRYAIVGLGARSAMYSDAIWDAYRDDAELVGFCDPNGTRMAYYNRLAGERYGLPPVPTYRPDDFARMLAEGRVDTAIVTSIDRTHHRYIIAAMEAGCDVITEKPLTIDAAKCQAIVDAQARTGRRLTVTFNYRYAPRSSKVKELLQAGAIGKVLSVHFEWLLDTQHGADYFRRWHRDKRNSGGLMVHKATHHFDLINWWLDSTPETVFAFGDLAFYGRENAEERGEARPYARAHGSEAARDDPFALHLDGSERLRGLYLEAEHEDGYHRDQSVFGDGISIEDDIAVLVRYASGATMSYHLTAYSPREGFRVAFNGTRGRLDLEVEETPYVSGARGDFNMPELRGTEPLPERDRPEIVLQPLWGRPVAVPVATEAGGHGGGDVRLLADLFARERPPDPLGRAAGPLDGVRSILTGIAANRAMQTGQPVRVADLVRL
jgi:predicted dehydrogenase